MNKNSKVITVICGCITAIATIIFYLMTFDNIFTIPMRWISLMTLIFTEIIGTVKALTIKKTIFGVSSLITSVVHLGVVLVMSIIFVNLMPLAIKTYILLNLLMLCILAVVDVVTIFAGGHVASKNKEVYQKQAVVDSCYTKAQSISIKYANTEYKNELSEIADMLIYSDNSELTNDEITILNKLDELNLAFEQNQGGVSDKITELKNIIKLRSIKISANKRGEF